MANLESHEWSTSADLDLFLELVRDRRRGVRRQIEDGRRAAIRSGRLGHGARLPPTRTLARDLGISRGTVMQAYAQLAAEGWIGGRRGSATRVAIHPERLPAPEPRPRRHTRWRFYLRPGRPDPSSFPRTEWMRALRQGLAATSDDAFGYGGPDGLPELRSELAAYLARARGLRVTADRLLVTSGFTQGLGLVARALARRGVGRIAMEEPSMPLHREIVRAAGHELVPVAVDGDGARVDELAGSGAGAVVLTPNRQHPTGVLLAAPRRASLLEWARSTRAVVLEDDYDGEFRYDGRPVGPLQGLDPGLVIYAGTVSKTLAPGVRLGWLVLPDPLGAAVRREKELADAQTSSLEQIALAELLRSGAYDRHIRRMRLRYRRRRDRLVEALRSRNPGLDLGGTSAGLNLLVRLPDAESEQAALAAAAAAG